MKNRTRRHKTDLHAALAGVQTQVPLPGPITAPGVSITFDAVMDSVPDWVLPRATIKIDVSITTAEDFLRLIDTLSTARRQLEPVAAAESAAAIERVRGLMTERLAELDQIEPARPALRLVRGDALLAGGAR